MLSFLIHGDTKAPVTGLNAFPQEDRPPVQIVFQTFHLMVIIGFLLIALNVTGAVLLLKGKLYDCRPVLWAFVFSVLGPQIANQVGWITAEVGRQPWIVHGLLRTSEALSKTVTANLVVISLIMFTIVYGLLFALFIFLLDRKIKTGPEHVEKMEGQRA
jgi:cytochrome d ubiquinol oxidase subunit I